MGRHGFSDIKMEIKEVNIGLVHQKDENESNSAKIK
jgi:hypothetical protein